jgi:hypothetical protein
VHIRSSAHFTLDAPRTAGIDRRKDRILPVFLNAFPLKIPEVELEARQVPYDKETLDSFRAKHGLTHSFRRLGDNILIFSGDATFPLSGTPHIIALKDNFGIFCSLVKDQCSQPNTTYA